MTSRQLYEGLLIELNKVNAPNILLEDFNYFANKAINQYINKRYNIYDINQQTTDDLRVLKATAILKPRRLKTYDALSLVNNKMATYYVDLPSDYLHLLNCICIYNVNKTYKCYNKGETWRAAATRLTADAYSQVLDNFWLRPTYKRPYYYIHNINMLSNGENYTQETIPTNPYRIDSEGRILGTDSNLGEASDYHGYYNSDSGTGTDDVDDGNGNKPFPPDPTPPDKTKPEVTLYLVNKTYEVTYGIERAQSIPIEWGYTSTDPSYKPSHPYITSTAYGPKYPEVGTYTIKLQGPDEDNLEDDVVFKYGLKEVPLVINRATLSVRLIQKGNVNSKPTSIQLEDLDITGFQANDSQTTFFSENPLPTINIGDELKEDLNGNKYYEVTVVGKNYKNYTINEGSIGQIWMENTNIPTDPTVTPDDPVNPPKERENIVITIPQLEFSYGDISESDIKYSTPNGIKIKKSDNEPLFKAEKDGIQYNITPYLHVGEYNIVFNENNVINNSSYYCTLQVNKTSGADLTITPADVNIVLGGANYDNIIEEDENINDISIEYFGFKNNHTESNILLNTPIIHLTNTTNQQEISITQTKLPNGKYKIETSENLSKEVIYQLSININSLSINSEFSGDYTFRSTPLTLTVIEDSASSVSILIIPVTSSYGELPNFGHRVIFPENYTGTDKPNYQVYDGQTLKYDYETNGNNWTNLGVGEYRITATPTGTGLFDVDNAHFYCDDATLTVVKATLNIKNNGNNGNNGLSYRTENPETFDINSSDTKTALINFFKSINSNTNETNLQLSCDGCDVTFNNGVVTIVKNATTIASGTLGISKIEKTSNGTGFVGIPTNLGTYNVYLSGISSSNNNYEITYDVLQIEVTSDPLILPNDGYTYSKVRIPDDFIQYYNYSSLDRARQFDQFCFLDRGKNIYFLPGKNGKRTLRYHGVTYATTATRTPVLVDFLKDYFIVQKVEEGTTESGNEKVTVSYSILTNDTQNKWITITYIYNNSTDTWYIPDNGYDGITKANYNKLIIPGWKVYETTTKAEYDGEVLSNTGDIWVEVIYSNGNYGYKKYTPYDPNNPDTTSSWSQGLTNYEYPRYKTNSNGTIVIGGEPYAITLKEVKIYENITPDTPTWHFFYNNLDKYGHGIKDSDGIPIRTEIIGFPPIGRFVDETNQEYITIWENLPDHSKIFKLYRRTRPATQEEINAELSKKLKVGNTTVESIVEFGYWKRNAQTKAIITESDGKTVSTNNFVKIENFPPDLVRCKYPGTKVIYKKGDGTEVSSYEVEFSSVQSDWTEYTIRVTPEDYGWDWRWTVPDPNSTYSSTYANFACDKCGYWKYLTDALSPNYVEQEGELCYEYVSGQYDCDCEKEASGARPQGPWEEEEDDSGNNNSGTGSGNNTTKKSISIVQGITPPNFIKINNDLAISNVERGQGIRYGNVSRVRLEIRYGTDSSVFSLDYEQGKPGGLIYIDYLKVPQHIRLTQYELDLTEDTSQVLEYPDYVCQEIINELTHIVMENISDPKLQTHPVVSQSIANPAQTQAPEAAGQSAQ